MEQHSSPNTVEGCILYYKTTIFLVGKGEDDVPVYRKVGQKVRESAELLSALLGPHLCEMFNADTRMNLKHVWNVQAAKKIRELKLELLTA